MLPQLQLAIPCSVIALVNESAFVLVVIFSSTIQINPQDIDIATIFRLSEQTVTAATAVSRMLRTTYLQFHSDGAAHPWCPPISLHLENRK